MITVERSSFSVSKPICKIRLTNDTTENELEFAFWEDGVAQVDMNSEIFMRFRKEELRALAQTIIGATND